MRLEIQSDYTHDARAGLRPLKFEAVLKNLKSKRLLDKAADYTLSSGQPAALLYKEEIERALKPPGVSGFQLLDLHDFPGKSRPWWASPMPYQAYKNTVKYALGYTLQNSHPELRIRRPRSTTTLAGSGISPSSAANLWRTAFPLTEGDIIQWITIVYMNQYIGTPKVRSYQSGNARISITLNRII